MIVEHDGTCVPMLPARWKQSQKDWLWFVWDDLLNGVSIIVSTWDIPDGWQAMAEKVDTVVVDDAGNEYSHANAQLLTFTGDPGSYIVSNNVMMSDGREYERAIRVVVRDV